MKTSTSKKLCILALAIGCALALASVSANASSLAIGFDENGAATFSSIDHITWATDTGLAIGFIPNLNFPPPNIQYPITFLLQGKASGFSLGGFQVTFPGLALDTKELTFTADFTETVASQGFDNSGNPIASFTAGNDPSSIFKMYLDGGAGLTKANPNVVSGYTDGTDIFTGHLASLTSSFTFDLANNTGTGSFDVKVAVDSFDPNYLSFPVPYIFMQFKTTGTLNQPNFFSPTQMFDGTPTNVAGDQLFRFDGSTDFTAVPEPSTILLLGTGFLALGVLARRKRS